jgi:hypothetical protein
MTADKSDLRASFERATKNSEAAFEEALQRKSRKLADMAVAMQPVIDALLTLKEECVREDGLKFDVDAAGPVGLENIRSAVARIDGKHNGRFTVEVEEGMMYLVCVQGKEDSRHGSADEAIERMIQWVGNWIGRQRAQERVDEQRKQYDQARKREESRERIERKKEEIEREREKGAAEIERIKLKNEQREARVEQEEAEQRSRDLEALVKNLPAIEAALVPIFERGVVNARNRYGVELKIQISEQDLIVSARRSSGEDNSLYSIRIFGSSSRITIELKREQAGSVEEIQGRYIGYVESFVKDGARSALNWLVQASLYGTSLSPSLARSRRRQGFVLGLATSLSIAPFLVFLAKLGLWPSGYTASALGLIFLACGPLVYLRYTKDLPKRLRGDLTE